jgi:hypothetical protein
MDDQVGILAPDVTPLTAGLATVLAIDAVTLGVDLNPVSKAGHLDGPGQTLDVVHLTLGSSINAHCNLLFVFCLSLL